MTTASGTGNITLKQVKQNNGVIHVIDFGCITN